jgi:hypothetical protein
LRLGGWLTVVLVEGLALWIVYSMAKRSASPEQQFYFKLFFFSTAAI